MLYLIPTARAVAGVLKNLLTSSDMRKDKEMARSTWEKDLGRMVWEKGIFLLSFMRASSMPVRLIAIKVVVASIGLCCEIQCLICTTFTNAACFSNMECQMVSEKWKI